MSDTISRQAAIDAMAELQGRAASKGELTGISKAWQKIKKLPSVKPKRGRWILDRSGAYCCSECMEPCASYVMMRPRDNFCKMCGADMRGEQDG